MQMVTLGTLSLSGAAGVVAMRRKLFAVGQRLGLSTGHSTRLAAAASDYAKTVVERGMLELRVTLKREGAEHELCVDFLDSSQVPTSFSTSASIASRSCTMAKAAAGAAAAQSIMPQPYRTATLRGAKR